MIKFTELPFEINSLEPFISKETIEYHYLKHHKGYFNRLIDIIQNTEFEKMLLEEIILKSDGVIFNNAAQIWNHDFYWKCISPKSTIPNEYLNELINKDFGNFEGFELEFFNMAMSNFGSGWTWLILESDSKLKIINTSNADTPLKHGKKPLLVIDVWEHAYYIDKRNDRANYIKDFFKIINWDFVFENIKKEA